MASAKTVVFTLQAAKETTQSVLATQAVHGFPSTGEDFMRVGLVPDVPYQPVFRCIENPVQRDGQFHGTQACRQVPAGAGDRFNQELAQFGGELDELGILQTMQVGRGIYLVE